MYRVLLVDDEAIVKIAMQNIIDWNSSNFEIVGSASNGLEALQFFSQHEFDAVITDLQMPVMDGISAMAAIPPPVSSTVCIQTTGMW